MDQSPFVRKESDATPLALNCKIKEIKRKTLKRQRMNSTESLSDTNSLESLRGFLEQVASTSKGFSTVLTKSEAVNKAAEKALKVALGQV